LHENLPASEENTTTGATEPSPLLVNEIKEALVPTGYPEDIIIVGLSHVDFDDSDEIGGGGMLVVVVVVEVQLLAGVEATLTNDQLDTSSGDGAVDNLTTLLLVVILLRGQLGAFFTDNSELRFIRMFNVDVDSGLVRSAEEHRTGIGTAVLWARNGGTRACEVNTINLADLNGEGRTVGAKMDIELVRLNSHSGRGGRPPG
jgi:hypothetical protein